MQNKIEQFAIQGRELGSNAHDAIAFHEALVTLSEGTVANRKAVQHCDGFFFMAYSGMRGALSLRLSRLYDTQKDTLSLASWIKKIISASREVYGDLSADAQYRSEEEFKATQRERLRLVERKTDELVERWLHHRNNGIIHLGPHLSEAEREPPPPMTYNDAGELARRAMRIVNEVQRDLAGETLVPPANISHEFRRFHEAIRTYTDECERSKAAKLEAIAAGDYSHLLPDTTRAD